MIRMLRILGVMLILIGTLVILGWLIEPIRNAWPMVYEWFRSLPTMIQFGLVVAAVGFLILLSSIIWERLEDRKNEGNLLDED